MSARQNYVNYVHLHHERIEFLWLAGWKSAAIAEEVGVCRGSVIRHVQRMGLPRKLPSRSQYLGNRRVDLWPWIFRWLKAGHSILEIKKAIGYRPVIYKNPEL